MRAIVAPHSCREEGNLAKISIAALQGELEVEWKQTAVGM